LAKVQEQNDAKEAAKAETSSTTDTIAKVNNNS
jgi:hypothetical protein